MQITLGRRFEIPTPSVIQNRLLEIEVEEKALRNLLRLVKEVKPVLTPDPQHPAILCGTAQSEVAAHVN